MILQNIGTSGQKRTLVTVNRTSTSRRRVLRRSTAAPQAAQIVGETTASPRLGVGIG